MRVLLDDQTVTIEEPTFAAAIAAGRRAAERRGRVLVEVSVDGRPAPESWLEDPAGEGREAAEVRLVSAEPVSLVQVTLLEVADALENVRAQQHRAAEWIQEDRLDQALGPLATVVATWTSVQQAVSNGAALLGLDLATVETASGLRLSEMIEDLTGRLREVKAALQGQDWTAAADVLGYEMDERAVAWGEALRRLASAVGAANG